MKNAIYGSIILFLIIMLYRAECGRPVVSPQVDKVVVDGKKYEVVKKVIDTQYIKYTQKGKTDTIVQDTVIYVKIPILDSSQIDSVLKLYYAKYVYLDTLRLKYGKIYVQDSVQQNKIIYRSWGADLLIPTEKVTITTQKPVRMQVYFGPKFEYSNRLSPGIGAILKTKRERIYGISVGLNGGMPVYGGLLYIKL
jgi:hypothetical protein